MIKVVQTSALPLGYVALFNNSADSQCRSYMTFSISQIVFRAGDETRTRDLLLGKEVFYQLNYARKTARQLYHGDKNGRTRVPRDRIELSTPRFSVACSTN